MCVYHECYKDQEEWEIFSYRWRNNLLEIIMRSHENIDIQHLCGPFTLPKQKVHPCLYSTALIFNKISGEMRFVSVDGDIEVIIIIFQSI